ncbi:MAG: aminomethyltransferase [Myxococcota bacterium]|jgi:aminomethyltransferase
MVPFAGWSMPVDYGSILNEAKAVRKGSGVFDVSHMARFIFRGEDIAERLDHALGGCITDQPIGLARYTMLLQEDAGILDDLLTYRLAEDEFMLVVNASNRERDWDLLTSRLEGVECADLTEDGGGILALQGPDSLSILRKLSGDAHFSPQFLELGEMETEFGGLFFARTGYTGEHGYELFPSAEQIVPLWEALMALDVAPVGLGSRDILRLEAALPLYGHEIHEKITPFDANLRFGVRGWKTRDFIGGDALRALPATEMQLIGLTCEKRIPREGYNVLCNDEVVGTICSGAMSVVLGHPIATAYIPKNIDGAFSIDFRGKPLVAQRAALPFVPHRSRD